jgi:hypothetical protein
MFTEQVSFVKACKDFFETGKHARKVEIAEFRELSTEDKMELRDLLIQKGYDVAPFPVSS